MWTWKQLRDREAGTYTMSKIEDHPNTRVSAHWGPKYGRQMLHDVIRNSDGSITGIAAGHDNGFTSSPDRLVTIPADRVRELRIKMVQR